jgi:4,5-DOPA dioxygenase extradiol
MAKMPVVFIGHGSPMNAIEDNEFTREWKKIASLIPKPEAILSVSAHWYTNGTLVMDNAHPRMIYDMYGFSSELYEIVYPAPGAPELARRTHDLLGGMASFDGGWGYDHGTWSVLHVMYPEARIPVFQLSVNRNAAPEIQYETGKKIASLRDDGVLILGSGNVVHNLRLVDFERQDGYNWAYEFDAYIRDAVVGKQFDIAMQYLQAGDCARMAFPSPDHFFPLLAVLGSAEENDQVSVFNDKCMMGSMSMTCYLFS